jgi:predicted transglutaminase-like cysteine proteinase
MPDEVELISGARVLRGEANHVVLHFRTVGGAEFYVGATLDNLRDLVTQWALDVTCIEQQRRAMN